MDNDNNQTNTREAEIAALFNEAIPPGSTNPQRVRKILASARRHAAFADLGRLFFVRLWAGFLVSAHTLFTRLRPAPTLAQEDRKVDP